MGKKIKGDLSEKRISAPTLCKVLNWKKNNKRYPLYEYPFEIDDFKKDNFPFIIVPKNEKLTLKNNVENNK
jgi:hypothetical protein